MSDSKLERVLEVNDFQFVESVNNDEIITAFDVAHYEPIGGSLMSVLMKLQKSFVLCFLISHRFFFNFLLLN